MSSGLRIWRSLERESSSPMLKSRKTTPTSASASMGSCSRASPKPCGPASTPATRSPVMVGKRSRPSTSATNTPSPATMTSSWRKGMWVIVAPVSK